MNEILHAKLTGNYGSTIFNAATISKIAASIYKQNSKYYLTCLVRNKAIQVKPEELIRQLMLHKLMHEYGYPRELLRVEYTINFGREKKLADIVILNPRHKNSVYCVVEVKKYKARDGKAQLKSYTNATGAPLAVWTNGRSTEYFERLNPNYFEPLDDIPKFNQTIVDVKKQTFTYLELMQQDRLVKEKKSLKSLIEDMEDEVLANAGVDVFEEAFKLIFTKLYDEIQSSEDRVDIEKQLKRLKKHHPTQSDSQLLKQIDSEDFRQLQFRTHGDAPYTQEIINRLFEDAKESWPGIFRPTDPFMISDPNHLQICVAFLQKVKLFNSNLQIIDEAFEYLVNQSAKGDKGQYFTPRNVIDMCVYMLNPQAHEYMIDTACGSCGFAVHTLFNVWKKLEHEGKAHFSNFSNQKLTRPQKDYVEKVFGIDFDEKAVRVSRTLNMIGGDGQTNVLHLNSLDYDNWDDKIKDRRWRQAYGSGYDKLSNLTQDPHNYKHFKFDLVLANPPFAGDIKDKRIIADYQISLKKGKQPARISRDVLFIERNLDFLKPGGRMAIVLPQSRFNNTSDQHIREFILERARVLAIIGLDGNTFKPHTGTKTSVLFVQKWDNDSNSPTYNPHVEDYPIFVATSQCSGKDNSGEPIYKKNAEGERQLDKHGHLIQRHDLDQIAFAFEAWAREQALTFWRGKP